MGVCNCVNPHPNCTACGNSTWYPVVTYPTSPTVYPTTWTPSVTYTYKLIQCDPHCFCADNTWQEQHKVCCKCGTTLHKKFLKLYLKSKEIL